MIHSFSAANFYSIGKEVKLDFVVGANLGSRMSYIDSAGGERVSLIEAVVGPNASGKTNLLKALPFMRWLIVDAYIDDPDSSLPVRPFADSPKDKPTKMNVIFSVNDRLFSYEFKLTQEKIIFEKLAERSRSNERITTKTLFSRAWDTQLNSYKIKDRVFGTIDENKIRKNSGIVATAFRDKNELGTLIAQYWRDSVSANVYERGYRVHHDNSLDNMANNTLDYFHENPALKGKLEEILSRYDIGFDNFMKEELQERKFYSIKHVYGKRNVGIPLAYESSGTKQLIVVLRYILQAMAVRGGIAVIDELDSNLHPEIVSDIIDMFGDPESNPNSTQILFSSHTPSVLATLDKQQIILVEKDNEGESQTWRLDTIKGVRSDDNYYAKYIAGAYRAVPNIG